MRDIVRMANRRYKLGIDDPTQGCSLPRGDPSREWLHPVQMQALLDAARTLDANPAQDAYAQQGRYSAVLALGLWDHAYRSSAQPVGGTSQRRDSSFRRRRRAPAGGIWS